MYTFLEFFAGGGMARLGLGRGWKCLLANDIDEIKAATYRANFKDTDELIVGDVKALEAASILAAADLAWGSFPCQDLSLAGVGQGLDGERSGAYWPFWRIMRDLNGLGRAPSIIALENVYGALTSHSGRDFAAIIESLVELDYRVGAAVIDAALFVPQSRPRLFVIAVKAGMSIPAELQRGFPDPLWHPKKMVANFAQLTPKARAAWVWWEIPRPPKRKLNLADIIEDHPASVEWHTPEQTNYLISLMSETHKRKLRLAKLAKSRVVGTLYRRTRQDKSGAKHQRAEVRFDNVAGCLRTPSGGSSRQTVVVVEGERVRSRLLSSREAARLMGLPETYCLPDEYNAAYHVAGDGVAVPAVRYLRLHLFERILAAAQPTAMPISQNDQEKDDLRQQLPMGQFIQAAL